MKKIIASLLVIIVVSLPLQIQADPQPPDQDWLLAACVVACAGIAVGAVYVFSKKCESKWYWLMDSEQPPNFWIASTTRKQCQVEGWIRIGGPYKSPQDAPTQHPSPTNRVEVPSTPMKLSWQASTNGVNWTTVYQDNCDVEDFGFFPTNAAMFRVMIAP